MRALQYPLRRREALGSWEAATAYLRARLTPLPREVFHVLFLDTKNQLIADERMAEGSVNHAQVYPREIVRRALELSPMRSFWPTTIHPAIPPPRGRTSRWPSG